MEDLIKDSLQNPPYKVDRNEGLQTVITFHDEDYCTVTSTLAANFVKLLNGAYREGIIACGIANNIKI